jgi:hypothetical protein
MEFWGIFWDKELMARFNPFVQLYVRHNAVWYASHLQFSAYEQAVEHDKTAVRISESSTIAEAPDSVEPPQEDLAYYTPTYDYAEYMRDIDVQSFRAEIQKLEAEKQALLKEAEYILIANAHKKYRYYYSEDMDKDERERRLRELHLCEIAYNRLSSAVNALDIKVTKMRLSLRHKAIVDAPSTKPDTLESWLPSTPTIDHMAHDPTISIQEMEKLHKQIAEEVKQFEEWIVVHGHSEQQRERWKRDLEDGRTLMKAADHILWELERAREGLGRKEDNRKDAGMRIKTEDKEVVDKVPVSAEKGAKTDEGGLEADKP